MVICMRKLSCKRCGAAFETDKRSAYLCPDCRLAAKRESVLRERVCIDCGAVFVGYPKSKRCPDCRLAARRENDAAYHRNSAARPIGSTDLCDKCGQPYIVNSSRQRYCKDCAPSAVAANVRDAKRVYQNDYAAQLGSDRNDNRRRSKICLFCGAVFQSGTARVTCSPECEDKLRKQRQKVYDSRRKNSPESDTHKED